MATVGQSGNGTRVAETLAEATAALRAAGVPTPRLDAEILLAEACGFDRTALYASLREPVPAAAAPRFRDLLVRRLRREPVAYLIGRQEFWSLDFAVTPDVLIPRPETELLVEVALAAVCSRRANGWTLSGEVVSRGDAVATSESDRGPGINSRAESLRSPLKGTPTSLSAVGFSRLGTTEPGKSFPGVGDGTPALRSWTHARKEGAGQEDNPLALCDVGTGSGCIAVALARALPQAEVWALDVSARALAVAETNARRHGVAERIRFVESDLFAAVAGWRFDMVVSNPPYLSEDDRCDLQPEVGYEPRVALDGGRSGLEVIRRFLAGARSALREDGCLLMEIGATQAADVAALARRAGFGELSVRPDAAGLPRVVAGR